MYQLHLNSEQYQVIWQQQKGVGKKLTSQSKKELVYFIQTKFEDYNPGIVSQKVLITVLLVRSQGIVIYKFFQTEGCTLYNVLLTVYTIQI